MMLPAGKTSSQHIYLSSEKDMVADGLTKPITAGVFMKHLEYTHNFVKEAV
jgi:hypothetical protein